MLDAREKCIRFYLNESKSLLLESEVDDITVDNLSLENQLIPEL